MAKVSHLGRVSSVNIRNVFDGRIDPEVMLVTNAVNAYVKFADETGHALVQLKGCKAKNGTYNIQCINGYHGRLKKFMMRFNGMATRYLNNRLVWQYNGSSYLPFNGMTSATILPMTPRKASRANMPIAPYPLPAPIATQIKPVIMQRLMIFILFFQPLNLRRTP